jgi:hypothetical protein
MEGATSTITNLGNGWVRKTMKRKAKGTKIHPIQKQLEIQKWSADTLTPANGFKLLYTPRAKANAASNSYQMEMIDDSKQISRIELPELESELIAYFQLAKKNGYMPSDFELYEQPNKRVALLDFDKYGILDTSGTHVVYPYAGRKSLKSIPREALYSEELHKKLKNSLKGGSRRGRKTRKATRDSSA